MKAQTTHNDTPDVTLPSSAGCCAFDLDECTVTIALDTEAEVRSLVSSLRSRRRARLVGAS